MSGNKILLFVVLGITLFIGLILLAVNMTPAHSIPWADIEFNAKRSLARKGMTGAICVTIAWDEAIICHATRPNKTPGFLHCDKHHCFLMGETFPVP